MLGRVVIENYRSCLRTSLDLHPNLSVLIGPNGSGKTNILQAIMFLKRMAQQDPWETRSSETLTVNSRLKATFQQKETRLQLSASFKVIAGKSNNDTMHASRQKWNCTQGKKRAAFEFPLAFASEIGAREMGNRYRLMFGSGRPRYELLKIVEGAPDWVFGPLGAVAAYCNGLKYYGASQFTNPGSCPASFHIEQEGHRRSAIHHHGHARIIYDMYSASRSDSNGRYAQFIDIVGPRGLRLVDALTFREVKTSSVDYTVRVGGKVETRKRHKLLVIPQFRIGKQKLSPNQLSEGTFKTLALLFHVITENGTALLVEEPEVCVHHGLLSSIIELIKSYSTHKQMILSTHSDYVLDHVKPENVYRVTFDRSVGTLARPIRKTMTAREYVALREYLDQEGNLGEYWREGGLGDRP